MQTRINKKTSIPDEIKESKDNAKIQWQFSSDSILECLLVSRALKYSIIAHFRPEIVHWNMLDNCFRMFSVLQRQMITIFFIIENCIHFVKCIGFIINLRLVLICDHPDQLNWINSSNSNDFIMIIDHDFIKNIVHWERLLLNTPTTLIFVFVVSSCFFCF